MKRALVDTLASALAAALLAASPLVAAAMGIWDSYWISITYLGEEGVYVVLSTLLYVGVSRELGFFCLLTLLSSGWVNLALKNALALPRPPPDFWKVIVEGYGFPSGHAQLAATFWLSLALKKGSFKLAAIGVIITALIACSRVVLGVHYIHDVLGGIILGGAISATAYWFSKLRLHLSSKAHALLLASYGAGIALLYQVYLDELFIKIGGVLTGASLYPLVKPKLTKEGSPLLRAATSLLVLSFASIMTIIASAFPPYLLYVAYSLLSAVIVSSPLLYSLKRF